MKKLLVAAGLFVGIVGLNASGVVEGSLLRIPAVIPHMTKSLPHQIELPSNLNLSIPSDFYTAQISEQIEQAMWAQIFA